MPLEIAERLAELACVRDLVVAEDTDQQHAHRRLPGHDVIEQHEARFVGPLQVVEHQDDGLLLGDGGEQADGRGEQQEPFRVGVGGLRRRESRDPAGECRHDAGELRPVRRDVHAQPLLRRVGHIVPERFGEELVGRGEVLLAVPEQHTRAVVEGGACGGGRDRRLPDPPRPRRESLHGPRPRRRGSPRQP